MATSRQFLSAVSDLPSVQAPLLFNSSAAEAPLPGLCAQCLVPGALTSLDLLCSHHCFVWAKTTIRLQGTVG